MPVNSGLPNCKMAHLLLHLYLKMSSDESLLCYLYNFWSVLSQGMRPLKTELVRGEKKGRGSSLMLGEKDRDPNGQQVGLAYRRSFRAKTARVDVEREADSLMSVPVDQPDDLAVFQDTSTVVAVLSGIVLCYVL